MKANELRIGNLVYCVDEVSDVDVSVLEMIDDGFGEWSPIPLTEEWLLRMGFEKHILDGRRCYSLQYDDRETLDIYEANGLFYFVHSGGTSAFIQSLHHLQNLYHIVTSKELTFKKQ